MRCSVSRNSETDETSEILFLFKHLIVNLLKKQVKQNETLLVTKQCHQYFSKLFYTNRHAELVSASHLLNHCLSCEILKQVQVDCFFVQDWLPCRGSRSMRAKAFTLTLREPQGDTLFLVLE